MKNEICILHISHTALAAYSEINRENELENPVISISEKEKEAVLKSIQSFVFANYPMKVSPIGIVVSADYSASQNTVVKALLFGYVSLLLDGAKWIKKRSSSLDISIKIIEYCYEHYTENISLYDTANALNTERNIARSLSDRYKNYALRFDFAECVSYVI